jgi:hypothetical protein
MDWTNNFDQFLRQLSDLQRGLFNSWTSAVPSMQSLNPLNSPENFEKTLKFQEEAVKSSLAFQALATSMSIETQKQFWEGYFNIIRKAQIKKAE